jgi:hypothetical protein
LALTDPAVVSWIPDTGQLTLGGGDPAALIADHYDRIAAIHWKDTKASYRGYTGPTPSDDDHRRESLYKDLGTSGVDLAGDLAVPGVSAAKALYSSGPRGISRTFAVLGWIASLSAVPAICQTSPTSSRLSLGNRARMSSRDS